MLNFNFPKQRGSLWHRVKVVFEQSGFKHGCEVLGNILAFMEAGLKIISNLCYVRDVAILLVLWILFWELELDLLS